MTAVRLISVLLYLSAAVNDTCAADERPVTAVQLIAAFSGKPADDFAPAFRFSEQARIVSIEMHAVGTDTSTARYTGRQGSWYEVNNILRIATADGYEGVSGVDTYYQGQFSDQHLQELQSVARDLVELKSLDPVEVTALLETIRPDLSDEVRASIDIALWDLAARKAEVPLSKLLGANRRSMGAYASLPFYETLPEYIDAVNRYAELGFDKFKFHVWGSIEEDIRLVELVQQTFSDSAYQFMIDLECMYERGDALRLGRHMDNGLFVWLEGPIDDSFLHQYAELRGKLSVRIIPAGYNSYSRKFLRQGIEAGSWDSGRFDATVVGGISKALELLIVANDADLPIEIQSWGHSLAQSANLHLMLANDRTSLFEAPMPAEVFEFGTKSRGLSNGGLAVATEGAGLGIEVDWENLDSADYHLTRSFDFSETPADKS